MSNENAIGLQIAAQSVRDIPADKSLTERLEYSMRYVREHESDVFWMSTARGPEMDDLKFRTAIAAVMLAGNASDRDILTRSVQPLRMLSAATQGIPVDFGALKFDEDMLPLMKLWHATETALPKG